MPRQLSTGSRMCYTVILLELVCLFDLFERSDTVDALTEYTLAASKYALIILSLVIIVRCIRSMLSDRYEPEVWGHLWHESRTYTLTHWENIIGRTLSCDVRLIYRTSAAPMPCSRATTRDCGASMISSQRAASGSTASRPAGAACPYSTATLSTLPVNPCAFTS